MFSIKKVLPVYIGLSLLIAPSVQPSLSAKKELGISAFAAVLGGLGAFLFGDTLCPTKYKKVFTAHKIPVSIGVGAFLGIACHAFLERTTPEWKAKQRKLSVERQHDYYVAADQETRERVKEAEKLLPSGNEATLACIKRTLGDVSYADALTSVQETEQELVTLCQKIEDDKKELVQYVHQTLPQLENVEKATTGKFAALQTNFVKVVQLAQQFKSRFTQYVQQVKALVVKDAADKEQQKKREELEIKKAAEVAKAQEEARQNNRIRELERERDAAQRAVAQQNGLRLERDSLQGQVDDLNRQVAQLRRQPQGRPEAVGEAQRLRDMQTLIQQRNQQIASLQREVESLRGQLNQQRNNSPQDQDQGVQDCSICMDPLTEGSDITRTPCGHTFHTACIDELRRQPRWGGLTCPNCRAAI